MTSWLLKFKLWRLGRQANPDSAWVKRLGQRLQAETGLPVRSVGLIWKVSLAALAVVLCLGVGTSGYAYASDDILPDHPLYPLRTTIEDAELAIAPTLNPQLGERVRAKMLQRQLKEIQIVNEKKLKPRPERLARLMNRYNKLVKEAVGEPAPVVAAAVMTDPSVVEVQPVETIQPLASNKVSTAEPHPVKAIKKTVKKPIRVPVKPDNPPRSIRFLWRLPGYLNRVSF